MSERNRWIDREVERDREEFFWGGREGGREGGRDGAAHVQICVQRGH